MKVLELFAGSRSIGKVAESRGHETFSSDFCDFPGIDYVADILEFDLNRVQFVPDMVWCSPPCTYFSVASIGKHWNEDHTPKTPEAVLGVMIVEKTLSIIEHFRAINPNLIWYMENPRGKLRKLDMVLDLPIRNTVTYCQYETDKPVNDRRMKPTDIWTNNPLWMPKTICKNGAPCHVSAPRGSSTGTQGIKGNYLRSVIPEALCVEVMDATELAILGGVSKNVRAGHQYEMFE